MPKIEPIGVYAVEAEEPVHLVEVWVRKAEGVFDVGDITQELRDQPKSNWQVPYSEYVLSSVGDEALTEESGRAKSRSSGRGTCGWPSSFTTSTLGDHCSRLSEQCSCRQRRSFQTDSPSFGMSRLAKNGRSKVPAPTRRPRFPLGGLRELLDLVCAPSASSAAVGEAQR
jgi:hypothetical protein